MTMSAAAPAPRVLYGCMGLGGDWAPGPHTAADVDAAEAAVRAALEIGVTAFDHADIYRHGKAESVFGEVLARDAGLRGRVLVQTKCGIRLATDERPGLYDLRYDSILARVRESLARLRSGYVDVLLLHRPDPLVSPAEIAKALTTLRADGLVHHVGVSNMSAAQITHLQAHLDFPLVANQLEMSLASRDWVESGVLLNTTEATANGFPHGTLEHCAAHGIQLQSWGSLAQGRYTGAAKTEAEHATSELVRTLAEAKGTTPETVVLWWLQRHPANIAPVLGSARPERIRACADAVRREPELTHEEWYRLWLTARGHALP
ncbi:putative oxidoreductase [Crossiella equi]|uniref:Oxidoreductase n=1 Tax=Crossiella equi TaxID=130796 RepID=A0ABS5A959_9PSEU|nr:aldo/keto reductase [Crossiella equi]MBP2473123.1 putative oxidoreductase [Crossiella equi]